MKTDLTAEEVREYLNYDPEEGSLIWIKAKCPSQKIGVEAGGFYPKGRTIGFNNSRYKVHRIIWLYMTGEWPKDQIDHINGNPFDNRWCNLREATQAQNQRNVKMPNTNTTGYKGVQLTRSGRYVATISFEGEDYSLGTYDTPEEASAVYEAKAEEFFGEFYRPIEYR